MLSKLPLDLKEVGRGSIDMDKEILRAGIIAELDAINFYEQMAHMTNDNDIKKVLLEVAKEEKEHVGEFHEMLLRRDKQQVDELQGGKEEVEELTGKK